MKKQTACQASHAFFQNHGCRYFPCHKTADQAVFNCLFCFCPLYFVEECGGDYTMIQGVKDCTPCIKPHAPGGYERTIERLKQEIARRQERILSGQD